MGLIVLWVDRFFFFFLIFSLFFFFVYLCLSARWSVFVLFGVSPTKVRLPHNPLGSFLECTSNGYYVIKLYFPF